MKETTWFRVSAWGRQAETCNQYLKMGSKVLVEGRLNPDRETGSPKVYQRKDGTHGSSYEITADRVVFMSGRDDQASYQAREPDGEVVEEDEIPF
jgi:single-strand DNA-binding protein